jgi:hypothetical protein
MRTETPVRHTRGRRAPQSPVRPGGGSRHGLLRIGLHLLLAALPLLAISAHVFGVVRMQDSAPILVIPLATAVVALTVLAPQAEDRLIAQGLLWGILGCAVYDGFRLLTVHGFGWWADFIPTMGTWITGNPNDLAAGAVVGYLWRYIGDGGGIGITFFAGASALGLHRRSRRVVVTAAVVFAVVPVWAGLIATVAIATRGQTMMFPLTPTTLSLSLIGHLIFGAVMGLGFWHARAAGESWPWEPLTGEQRIVIPSTPIPAAPDGALPSPRAPQTPPGGQSLDPATFELWQRQLRSTARGRRTHGVR